MRILFTCGLVGRGGDAVQVLQLADALRSLGHDVKLAGSHPLSPYVYSGAAGRLRNLARCLPWWAKDAIELEADRRARRTAVQLLAEGSYDLVFHRAGIYDRVGVRLAANDTCPIIAWLDAPFPVERAFRNQSYFKGLHRSRMRALGRRSRLIVTVSQASKDYYVGLGLPAQKIIVVPNGVSQHAVQQGTERSREHPPLPEGNTRCVIGFVGSLSRWHGVGLLFESLRELGAPTDRRWQVRIVGYGEEYRALHARARALGVDACVKWLGALPHDRVMDEIAQFDIAVLPNTLTSGSPIKLFEYAALARPAIAPDLPNLRRWFTEEEMLYFQPGDASALAQAIRRLAEEPRTARQLGLRAQERVQREYTWQTIVQGILDAAADQDADAG